MHELPVAESMLEIAQRAAQEAGGPRVVALHLVIGQLSSIVDDSIQFYWDIISQGTLAEGAELHFRRVPGELLCLDCGHRYFLEGGRLACPNCGSAAVKVIAGEEFRMEAIDVEDEAELEGTPEGAAA
jgi:hydrogenase nickel incorporation protein HypA/HybF